MPLFKYQDITVYYEGASAQSKNTLLCLHGWGTSHSIWHYASKFLPEWNIITLDLPGMGRSSYSSHLSEGYIDTACLVIKKLLKELHVNKCSYLGHSIGGIILSRLARCKEFAYERLILDSTPLLGSKGVALRLRLFGIHRLMGQVFRSRQLTKRILGKNIENLNAIPSAVLEPVVDALMQANKDALFASFKESTKTLAIDDLNECHAQFLYITGCNNKTLDWKSLEQELRQTTCEFKIVTVPDARHYSQLENPRDYYQEIEKFLRG